MTTRSVYDPKRHLPEQELRFANAALLNASIAYVESSPDSIALFQQLEVEVKNVVRLRALDPFLNGTFTIAGVTL